VRTTGKVSAGDATSFYLDDGSMDLATLESVRPKVALPSGVPPPAVGSVVMVTGISSCEMVSGEVRRLLRLRGQSDIVVLMPP